MDKWTSGAAYEVWMGRWSRLLAHEFLKWLSVPAHARWLDVCCGSGIVSQAIAETCSPTGIVGVDASPGQVAFAREQNTHTNLTFTVANASALPFEDEGFDVAVCCLGLNFITQPEQALREMRRATRSGGTVAAYVWDYAQGARFLREFWDAATAVDPEGATFDQARRFPLCAQDPLRKIFEMVKLESVALTSLNVVTRFANFDDYWQPFSSGQGSAPNYLATRDARTRNAIRERLRTSLPSDADGAIALPARAWAVRGQRP
ncbi:MAG: class I SAM-dependent methyltransferase [Terriglobales bacterium]